MNYRNKTLLITGGTGSFGNTLLKHALSMNFKEIRIFSRDEKKQEDMRISFNNSKLNFIIGDIRDFESISEATQNVDYVFHAAALKQVPSCEFYPEQAMKTNIIGAANVINSCVKNEVSNLVVLSTDKAVYPINAMGISKAMMEKLAISKGRGYFVGQHKTKICVTRYGNVMASRGSIIPLFVSQIKNGDPLTITNPDMTRFMMTLQESVDLVMYAFENGNSGDLFVQKSPGATINTLSNAIIKLFGNANSVKNIIGERHAEKMHETLCSREEMAKAEDMGKYYRIPADIRDLNYQKYVANPGNNLSDTIEYNSKNTYQLNTQETIDLLLKLDFINSELNDTIS